MQLTGRVVSSQALPRALVLPLPGSSLGRARGDDDVDEVGGRGIAEEIPAAGGTAVLLLADVTVSADALNLVDTAVTATTPPRTLSSV